MGPTQKLLGPVAELLGHPVYLPKHKIGAIEQPLFIISSFVAGQKVKTAVNCIITRLQHLPTFTDHYDLHINVENVIANPWLGVSA